MRMLIKARHLIIRSAQSGGGNLRMMATIIIVLLSGVFAFAIAFLVKWFVAGIPSSMKINFNSTFFTQGL